MTDVLFFGLRFSGLSSGRLLLISPPRRSPVVPQKLLVPADNVSLEVHPIYITRVNYSTAIKKCFWAVVCSVG